jgi:hypothetical protein
VLDARRVAPEEPPHAVLGVKPEGMSDPVVVLEQIERHVDREYLPILEGRSYRLADDGWNRTSRGRQATAAVTFAIRRELRVALGREIVTHDRARDRLRELVRASVRHHEAQHVLEQDRPPVYPAALARLAGPLQVNGHPVASAIRARNELSAYTSQIASDMWLPQAALWNLARHAFERSRRGTPESYAAVIVLEGLSRQLGVPPPHGPTIHHGEIDRDRLAELVTPLAARSTIELRSAAARLWAELFGEPLVRLVDDRVGE